MDIRKHITSWKLWLVVSIILAIMEFQKNGSLSAFLPYLAILICPIMMMFMMGGHDHSEKPKDDSTPSQNTHHSDKLK